MGGCFGGRQLMKKPRIDRWSLEGSCGFATYMDLEGGNKEAVTQKQAKAP
jgi:hypothetical protein